MFGYWKIKVQRLEDEIAQLKLELACARKIIEIKERVEPPCGGRGTIPTPPRGGSAAVPMNGPAHVYSTSPPVVVQHDDGGMNLMTGLVIGSMLTSHDSSSYSSPPAADTSSSYDSGSSGGDSGGDW